MAPAANVAAAQPPAGNSVAQKSNNHSVLENALNATKSPRVNRAKNVSPPSREGKSYLFQAMSGGGGGTGPVGLIAPANIMMNSTAT